MHMNEQDLEFFIKNLPELKLKKLTAQESIYDLEAKAVLCQAKIRLVIGKVWNGRKYTTSFGGYELAYDGFIIHSYDKNEFVRKIYDRFFGLGGD